MVEQGKKPQKAVCWDLDQTIGDFTGLTFMRTGNKEFSIPLKLRYGMRELLNDFSEDAGYVHYITSSASMGYIGEVLRRVELDKKFKKTFDGEQIDKKPTGKLYRPVARDMRYTDEEVHANMIAIGDSDADKPVDIAGLVFVQMDLELDAFVTREILTSLLEKGDGNFKKGFEMMYSEGKDAQHTDPTGRKKREYDLGNDIRFYLEYRNADEVKEAPDSKVPVIYRIRTDTHKKPPTPIF